MPRAFMTAIDVARWKGTWWWVIIDHNEVGEIGKDDGGREGGVND
jgi:hypothetical protein